MASIEGEGLLKQEVLGFELVINWVWEFILKRTRGPSIIDAVERSCGFRFPSNIARLNQMHFVRSLTDIAEDHGIPFDSGEAIRFLDGLRTTLVTSDRVNGQQARWGPGFAQLTLSLGELDEPIQVLQAELMSFERRRSTPDQDAEPRQLLSDFIQFAWSLFGRLALDKIFEEVTSQEGRASLTQPRATEELEEETVAGFEEALRKLQDERVVWEKALEDQKHVFATLQTDPERTLQIQDKLTTLHSEFAASGWKPKARFLHSDAKDTSPTAVLNPSPTAVLNPFESLRPVVKLQSASSPSGVAAVPMKKFSAREDYILQKGLLKYGEGNLQTIIDHASDSSLQGRSLQDVQEHLRSCEENTSLYSP